MWKSFKSNVEPRSLTWSQEEESEAKAGEAEEDPKNSLHRMSSWLSDVPDQQF